METFLILCSFLCLIASAIMLIITIIRRILHKSHKTLRKVYLSLAGAAVAVFFGGIIIDDPHSSLTLLGVFLVPVILILLIVSIVFSALHKKSLKLWISTGVVLSLCVGTFIASDMLWKKQMSNHEAFEIKIQIDPDFEVVEGEAPLEILKSRGFGETSISKYRNVFESEDMNLMLDKDYACAAECRQVLLENHYIDEEHKKLFLDFIDRIGEKYPDMNLAILYRNLKTLKVVILPRMQYIIKSFSADSYGCYIMPENTIYIPEGTEYKEGEWGFQIILHEFCHAARECWYSENDINYRIKYCSLEDTALIEECMNSVFSCSLLNYYERDIAYQIPSNYLRIILECMDNFDISDYYKHSDAYFLSKLDEATGHTNYAHVIWKLITLQRSDCLDDRIDIAPERFEPIYTFLCDMYFDKYITRNMSSKEMKKVVDELVDKAFFDAPDKYKIDKDFFYSYLDTYLENNYKKAA